MIEQYRPETKAQKAAFKAGQISALVQACVQRFNPGETTAKYVYPHQPTENHYEDRPSGEYKMELFYGILIDWFTYPIARATITRSTWWTWEDRINDETPYEDQRVTFTFGKKLLLKTGSRAEYYSGATDIYTPNYQALNAEISSDSLDDIEYRAPLEVRDQDLINLLSELENPGRDTRYLEKIVFP